MKKSEKIMLQISQINKSIVNGNYKNFFACKKKMKSLYKKYLEEKNKESYFDFLSK